MIVNKNSPTWIKTQLVLYTVDEHKAQIISLCGKHDTANVKCSQDFTLIIARDHLHCFMLCNVSSGTGDHWPCRRTLSVYNQLPGQLSLAIPPWLGTMSTGESWETTTHHVIHKPQAVVLQYKLVSGWQLQKWRSVSLIHYVMQWDPWKQVKLKASISSSFY